jgi:MFS superfamily sulfate permease-like transporter
MPVLGRQPGTQVFRSIDEYPDSETYPGLLVMDFDAGLFFASADGLVRRRLIQKMEKLSLHLSWTEPPTPEELVAYYAANSE